MTKLSFCCRSQRHRNSYHLITFYPETHTVNCSCLGGSFCSHIDATLVAGERAMVMEEEWPIADEIMKKMEGRLEAPEGWPANWRKRAGWRGLPSARYRNDPRFRNSYDDGRPAVCFTGKGLGKSRKEYLDEAEAKGFRPVKQISGAINIVVAESPFLKTAKIKGAAQFNIPVLSYEEWEHLTSDGEFVEDTSQIKLQDLTEKVEALNKSFADETEKEKEEYRRQRHILERGEVMDELMDMLSEKNPDADIHEITNRPGLDLSEEAFLEAAIKELQKELDLLEG